MYKTDKDEEEKAHLSTLIDTYFLVLFTTMMMNK